MAHAHHHQNHHDHGHGSGYAHHHGPMPGGGAAPGWAFAVGIGLNLGFVAIEAGFGWFANSLALIADAAHNFSDVIGLVLAWGASWLGARARTDRFTYGYRRASILAALANAGLLLVTVGGIIVEAVQRFQAPEPVVGQTVLWVAGVGIVINTATALLFFRGRHHDLNQKGAFLHMAADAAVSLGVLLAGLATIMTGVLWIDPAVSVVIGVVILVGTWGLARDASQLALDAVPAGIDGGAVAAYLAGLPGVSGVHDLHIWAMSTTETALTAHLVRPNATLDDGLLATASRELDHRFGIRHVTLQVEAGDAEHPCPLSAEGVV